MAKLSAYLQVASVPRHASLGSASYPSVSLAIPSRTLFLAVIFLLADGGGAPERLANGEGALASTVTHDGRSLVFERRVGGTWSVWKTTSRAPVQPVTLVKDTSDSYMPSVSPDGRWLAYLSDISGRHEVYLRPFAGARAPDQISTYGGTEPWWSSDGRHLYYRAEGEFVEATLTLGVRAAVSVRRALFSDNCDGGMPHADYDVVRDGKGFVTIAARAGASPETGGYSAGFQSCARDSAAEPA